jgi:hypothetical protein
MESPKQKMTWHKTSDKKPPAGKWLLLYRYMLNEYEIGMYSTYLDCFRLGNDAGSMYAADYWCEIDPPKEGK